MFKFKLNFSNPNPGKLDFAENEVKELNLINKDLRVKLKQSQDKVKELELLSRVVEESERCLEDVPADSCESKEDVEGKEAPPNQHAQPEHADGDDHRAQAPLDIDTEAAAELVPAFKEILSPRLDPSLVSKAADNSDASSSSPDEFELDVDADASPQIIAIKTMEVELKSNIIDLQHLDDILLEYGDDLNEEFTSEIERNLQELLHHDQQLLEQAERLKEIEVKRVSVMGGVGVGARNGMGLTTNLPEIVEEEEEEGDNESGTNSNPPVENPETQDDPELEEDLELLAMRDLVLGVEKHTSELSHQTELLPDISLSLQPVAEKKRFNVSCQVSFGVVSSALKKSHENSKEIFSPPSTHDISTNTPRKWQQGLLSKQGSRVAGGVGGVIFGTCIQAENIILELFKN